MDLKRARNRGKTEIVLDLLEMCRNYPGYHVSRLVQFQSISYQPLKEIIFYLVERGLMEKAILDKSYSEYEIKRGTVYFYATDKGKRIADLWTEIKKGLSKNDLYNTERINGISISQRQL